MKNVDVIEKVHKNDPEIVEMVVETSKITDVDNVKKDEIPSQYQLSEEYSKLLTNLKAEDWKHEFNNSLLKKNSVEFKNSHVYLTGMFFNHSKI